MKESSGVPQDAGRAATFEQQVCEILAQQIAFHSHALFGFDGGAPTRSELYVAAKIAPRVAAAIEVACGDLNGGPEHPAEWQGVVHRALAALRGNVVAPDGPAGAASP